MKALKKRSARIFVSSSRIKEAKFGPPRLCFRKGMPAVSASELLDVLTKNVLVIFTAFKNFSTFWTTVVMDMQWVSMAHFSLPQR